MRFALLDMGSKLGVVYRNRNGKRDVYVVTWMNWFFGTICDLRWQWKRRRQ